ncbi:hypothetical protein AB0G67_17760 [Streptomyces sp. NPDC021056]
MVSEGCRVLRGEIRQDHRRVEILQGPLVGGGRTVGKIVLAM